MTTKSGKEKEDQTTITQVVLDFLKSLEGKSVKIGKQKGFRVVREIVPISKTGISINYAVYYYKEQPTFMTISTPIEIEKVEKFKVNPVLEELKNGGFNG